MGDLRRRLKQKNIARAMAINASGTATAGPMIAPRCFLPESFWDTGDRPVAVTGAADTEEVEMMVLTAVAFWLTSEVTTLTLGLFVFDEGPFTISGCGVRLEEDIDEKEEEEVDEEDGAAGLAEDGAAELKEDGAAELVKDGDDPCGNIDLRLSSEKRELVVSQQAWLGFVRSGLLVSQQ